MHTAFGDYFAGEMGELLHQPDILQQGRTARPRGLNVEIIRDRGARCMGQRRSFGLLVHGGSGEG